MSDGGQVPRPSCEVGEPDQDDDDDNDEVQRGCFQTPVTLWDRLGCPLFHGLLCCAAIECKYQVEYKVRCNRVFTYKCQAEYKKRERERKQWWEQQCFHSKRHRSTLLLAHCSCMLSAHVSTLFYILVLQTHCLLEHLNTAL